MIKRKTALNLVVAVALALSLAACGGSSTTPTNPNPGTPTDPDEPGTPTDPEEPTTPTPKEISGTIEGWTGGEAVVRAESYNSETGEPFVLEQGTISADGSFNLTLPVGEDIPADSFFTVREADICPTGQGTVNTVEVTPSGPFDLATPYFSVYDSTGSDYLGDIYLSGDSLETSYTYVYAASDVTVTGECGETSSGSGGSSSSTVRYDLDLKAGWNEVISTYGEEAASVSTGSIPAGISWSYYSEIPPLPCEPDDPECLPEPPVPPCEPDDPECLPEPPVTPARLFLGRR